MDSRYSLFQIILGIGCIASYINQVEITPNQSLYYHSETMQ